MDANVGLVSDSIREVVGSLGVVSGTTLAERVRARHPGIGITDLGSKSLRDFIAHHVSGVRVVGRAGMDVVYGLDDGPPQSPRGTELPKPDLWRIWVSPNSPQSLVLDPETRRLYSGPKRDNPPTGAVMVNSPNKTEHRAIAERFLPSLPAGLRLELSGVLTSQVDGWWQEWVSRLRGSEYLATWNAFRRQELEDLLRQRLQSVGMPPPEIEVALSQVHESHSVARKKAEPVAEARPSQLDLCALKDLRRLVMIAVSRMSQGELRELRLPLGLVLDSISESHLR